MMIESELCIVCWRPYAMAAVPVCDACAERLRRGPCRGYVLTGEGNNTGGMAGGKADAFVLPIESRSVNLRETTGHAAETTCWPGNATAEARVAR